MEILKHILYSDIMQSFRFSKVKKILIVAAFVILFVTVKLLDSVIDSNELVEGEKKVESSSHKTEKAFLKVFHLDLKGGAPKLNYLLKVLPLIREAGANAILIEYEDMFPFSGKLKQVSATNAYSLREVRMIVQFAESLQMEVIPLVQTFGHLEYVLKLEEFESLRESEAFPQEICPLNREAVELVKEMIKQIMAAHPKSRYVHIGCDEVRHVGTCSRCSRVDPKKLFANHVNKMANFIKAHYPKVIPLIWDDMLRRWTYKDMEKSQLGSAVEPVVWVYGKEVMTLAPQITWNIYERIFPTVWIASAFKGAFGETETLPNLTLHLENNLSWMKILTHEDENLSVKSEIPGIFITGWSRYDHFAVLCELLPVGIPSLILSLTFLSPEVKGNRTIGLKKWLSVLRCPEEYVRDPHLRDPEVLRGTDSVFELKLGNCSFPGSELYSGVVEYRKLKDRVVKMRNTIESGGWTNAYNFRKNFTSPWRLVEMFRDEGFAGEVLQKEISDWKSSFLLAMEKYFDSHTRNEWEEQNIRPLEETLEEIHTNFVRLIEKRRWPRRPLG